MNSFHYTGLLALHRNIIFQSLETKGHNHNNTAGHFFLLEASLIEINVISVTR